jgi:hypothetical protein
VPVVLIGGFTHPTIDFIATTDTVFILHPDLPQ